jgi:hypothetical protein
MQSQTNPMISCPDGNFDRPRALCVASHHAVGWAEGHCMNDVFFSLAVFPLFPISFKDPSNFSQTPSTFHVESPCIAWLEPRAHSAYTS